MTKIKKLKKHQIEKEVEAEVTYVCPVRGKVTEKVRGYRLKLNQPIDEDVEDLIKSQD